MKHKIHPTNYRPVVFEDLNNGSQFLIRSTVSTDKTVKYKDGQTYPLVKVHISSASHPYYTGQEKLIDIEGRIDKFKARQKMAQKAQALRQSKQSKTNNKKDNRRVPTGREKLSALKSNSQPKPNKPKKNKK